MARIRSIHPGIWTDENFAMLTMASRVLLFGIWTEADDHGIFEWKPIALKMRIFPADKVDIDPLLADLLQWNVVTKFSHEGREYGAVRNFCKFQRPKKPTYRFPLPESVGKYVGLANASSVPIPHQDGTGTEKSSQMKEEGGRREEEKESKEDTASAVSPSKYAFEAGIIRLTPKDFQQWKESFSHLDLAAELVGMRQWADEQGPKWFHAVSGALAKRNREIGLRKAQSAAGPPSKEADQDKKVIEIMRKKGVAVVFADEVPGGIPGIS